MEPPGGSILVRELVCCGPKCVNTTKHTKSTKKENIF